MASDLPHGNDTSAVRNFTRSSGISNFQSPQIIFGPSTVLYLPVLVTPPPFSACNGMACLRSANSASINTYPPSRPPNLNQLPHVPLYGGSQEDQILTDCFPNILPTNTSATSDATVLRTSALDLHYSLPDASTTAADMLIAPAMDHNVDKAAGVVNYVDEVPQLMGGHEILPLNDENYIVKSMGIPDRHTQSDPAISFPQAEGEDQWLMYCDKERVRYTSGAFSDSEAMDQLTNASGTPACTPLSYLTSITTHLYHGHLSISAPVSPTPSVNYTEPTNGHGLLNVEDMGSTARIFADMTEQKTDRFYVKSQFEKRAGRKTAGISKRRQARRKGQSALPYTNNNAGPQQLVNSIDDSSEARLKVKTTDDKLNDGYWWRKYGEKKITGKKYPRTYFKCAGHMQSGCPVIKRTQRCSDDEDYVDFHYFGKHSHPPP